jgi:hypothetical protein
MRLFQIILIISLISGCTGSVQNIRPKIVSDSIKTEFSDIPPVLLAADLQIHYLYNSINTRKNLYDSFSESIRPSIADYLAPVHFNRIIDEYRQTFPTGKVVILGDVLDVSCDWEANKFLNMMKDKTNWVLAPGNHDFIFLGTHEKKERTKDWLKACEQKGEKDGRFNKVEFIFSYLEALAEQSKIPNADPSYSRFADCFAKIRTDRRKEHNDCLYGMKLQEMSSDDKVDRNCAAHKGLGDKWVNCKVASNIPERLKDIPNQGWWKNDKEGEFLRDIFWYINPADEVNSGMKEAYYSYSYIIQRVSLPDGRLALLLDTNNPGQMRPAVKYLVGYNPANSANMLYHQMNAASLIMGGNNVWSDEGKNLTKSKYEHVLMSHHPVKDYKLEAKKGLCLLANVGNVKDLYTAHTHAPNTVTHNSLHWRLKGCDNIKEHNIGSMIDYPLEYMLISRKSEQNNSLTVDLSSEYKKECVDFEYRWKRKKGNSDYYTSYNDLGWFASEEEIHANLLNSLLTHFIEMLDKEEGFITSSGAFPDWAINDQEIKAELNYLRSSVINDELSPRHRDRLIEIGEFFENRVVKDQENLNKYMNCQLHWASESKKELR